MDTIHDQCAIGGRAKSDTCRRYRYVGCANSRLAGRRAVGESATETPTEDRELPTMDTTVARDKGPVTRDYARG